MEPGEVDQEERSRFPAALAAGAVVVLLVAGVIALLTHFISPSHKAADTALPFGAAEQAYAAQIQFQNLQLSHSTNLLNQEFTYVGGTFPTMARARWTPLKWWSNFTTPFIR